MLPIAADIGIRKTVELAHSALPDAPTVPDPPRHDPRLRVALAAALRVAARRQKQWADRLDPRVEAWT